MVFSSSLFSQTHFYNLFSCVIYPFSGLFLAISSKWSSNQVEIQLHLGKGAAGVTAAAHSANEQILVP